MQALIKNKSIFTGPLGNLLERIFVFQNPTQFLESIDFWRDTNLFENFLSDHRIRPTEKKLDRFLQIVRFVLEFSPKIDLQIQIISTPISAGSQLFYL